MSTVSTDTVIGFAVVGCIGTFCTAIYCLGNAVCNRTGPMKDDKHMKDYSGRFEIDILPVFINSMTCIFYLGEALEEYNGEFGFFNKYRYVAYLGTCPLMMFELVTTIGAPYPITMSTITFMSLLSALFADLAEEDNTTWAWFSLGTMFFIILAYLLYNTHKYAIRLNLELCGQLESMNNELKSIQNNDHILPSGMLCILTPMDIARRYIEGAFYLMWLLWPLFPLTFILEKSLILDRNESQVIYSTADLVCKTLHSFFLDNYKHGLRQTIFSYGFLDSNVLTEIDIWSDESVYLQLKKLSIDTYGTQFTDENGKTIRPSSNLDFHSLLVANQRNHTVSGETEVLLPHPSPKLLSRRGSYRMNSHDSIPVGIKSKKHSNNDSDNCCENITMDIDGNCCENDDDNCCENNDNCSSTSIVFKANKSDNKI